MPKLPRILRRLARAATAMVALVVAASALSSCSLLSESSGGGDSGSGSFPVTIKHAHGEATIKKEPERIVTVGWLAQDVVAALGTVPVGVTDFTWGNVDKYLPWFEDRVKELDGELPELIEVNNADEASAEQVLDLNPDLIVAPHSGITEANYKKLSKIAPTIAYDKQPWQSDWKDVTTTVGKAMGKEKQARKLLDKTENLISDTAKENPQFADVTFAYGWNLPKKSTQMPLYVETDPRVQLIQQLGLTLSPQIAEMEADPGTFNTNVSLEEIDTIDAKIFIGWVTTKADVDRTLNNPVLKEWKPLASGSYYMIDDMAVGWASSAPTVLGIPWAMDEIVKGVDKAVAGKE